jgi:hypothetical protein
MAGISCSRRWRVPNQHASRHYLVRAVVGVAVRQARVLARINFRPLQTAEHVRLEILDIRGALKLRDPELGYSAKLVLYVHASHLGQNDFGSYLQVFPALPGG